eukprot:PLAT12496.23.p2 GENE.PLAT12496.23~~PLAT12496.23.p2  ORF type:complete len:645 (+),score=318.96 PLAT12496.23:69-2003(+)
MVRYNFKDIAHVPNGTELIDIILSMTQRKTPTVVHPGYHPSRIRQFYMRKVKYTAQSVNERLSRIIKEFPRLDDIHPFYADLCNVLYDRAHYKLALGQLHTARAICERICKDYIKLLKHGENLYRCKCLKRAALGRMMKVLKGQNASLAYLEEVRKHLARLPSIDPSARTLLICGFPNVGKSSFVNKVTEADVEVQDYAFTTQSLFVGHLHYKYMTWQVLDTPGILDRELDERNDIEMQAVMALAHLKACVLYFMDVSEKCGYTVEQQVSLFRNISPLFSGKPILLVLNKTDRMRLDDLEDDKRALVVEAAEEMGAEMFHTSNVTTEGLSALQEHACDKLLDFRLAGKSSSSRVSSILNRITVTDPVPRDDRIRDGTIPDSVLARRAAIAAGREVPRRVTEKDKEDAMGGAGVYASDYRRHWKVLRPEWKDDIIPEFYDGKNVLDFVDPDIDEKLAALEAEEEALLAALVDEEGDGFVDSEDEETRELIDAIQARKKIVHLESAAAKGKNRAGLPRHRRPAKGMEEFKEHLRSKGVEHRLVERRRGRKRERSLSRVREREELEGGLEDVDGFRSKRGVSRSVSVKPGEGYRDVRQKTHAGQLMKRAQRRFGSDGRRGHSDRHVYDLKPKHLLTGKRGIGSTDRR